MRQDGATAISNLRRNRIDERTAANYFRTIQGDAQGGVCAGGSGCLGGRIVIDHVNAGLVVGVFSSAGSMCPTRNDRVRTEIDVLKFAGRNWNLGSPVGEYEIAERADVDVAQLGTVALERSGFDGAVDV